MAKLIQSVEFFVVGGAVQADRSCYIERSADQHLIDAVVGQRFAFVLAPRGSGKTSLMLRVSSILRAEAQLTAVVDLRQIAAHGEGADPSRWFYGVARRICRELRLKFDLQTWWQERSALNAEQRFAEYFADVVLAHTKEPVTVFFDEIEHVGTLSFASDFFEVIRNCYALRASEPEYARLNFVVLGAGSQSRLCPDAAISPFVIGEEIALPDFTLEQTYQFEPGFDVGSETALGLIERIYSWTNGQPYLTQKLSRAVARRGGRLEDVERCAQELFLAVNSVSEEPQLTYVANELTARGQALRAALLTLRRLSQGAEVPFDSASKAHERLIVAGVARRAADGALAVTNRIYQRVFDDRWTRLAMPFNWRGVGVAAGVAVLLFLTPYWYFNFLPRPYVQTLAAPSVDFDSARLAYDRLHRLPGFSATADDMFAEVLTRRARSIDELDEILANDALVRSLEDREALADQLLAEFWLRRSQAAVNNGDRDAALIFAMAARDGLPDAAGAVIDALGSDDYARLTRSIRLAQNPVDWSTDDEIEGVTIVDESYAARIIRLPELGWPQSEQAVALTALQHTAFIRELSVDSEGSAGGFALNLVIDHPAASELTVTLAAPSGASVTVALSDALRESDGFEIDAQLLGALADERRQGVWRLTIVDAVAGNAGVLHRWSLEFDNVSDTWLGAPDAGVPIPEPIRTDEVRVALSSNGKFAVAFPAPAGVSGSLAVWDLEAGSLLHDLRLDREVQSFELTADGSHLLAVAGDELLVWSVVDGAIVARIATQTEFVLRPALSRDGGYVAIAERVEEAEPLFSLIRISDGQLVASVSGHAEATSWVLGPEARYLALLDGSPTISLMEPRRGTVVASLELERPAVRLVPVDHGELLVTIDAAGSIRVWRFNAAEEGIALGETWSPGTTSEPSSVSVSRDATTLAWAARPGEVVVHDLRRQRAPLVLRAGNSQPGIATRLSADGTELLTLSAGLLRSWNVAERPLGMPQTAELTAMTIGAEGRLAALGFGGGFVRAASLSDPNALLTDNAVIDYIGHRGPVTAIALNVEQNLVASGGRDGTARLWNLATLSPADAVMSEIEGPLAAVSLSADGRWLLAGGQGAAGVWRIPDAQLAARFEVNGIAGAVAFSDRAQWLAIGDTTGNLIVARPGQAQPQVTARADSAITALAFSPAGDYVVSGDALGNLRFWTLRASVRPPQVWQAREPIRWLAFAGDEQRLVVQTQQWLHVMQPGEPTRVVATRLLPAGLEPGAAAIDDSNWRLLSGLLQGQVAVTEVNFADAATPDAAPAAAVADALRARPWDIVLGIELDENGNPVPVIH